MTKTTPTRKIKNDKKLPQGRWNQQQCAKQAGGAGGYSRAHVRFLQQISLNHHQQTYKDHLCHACDRNAY